MAYELDPFGIQVILVEPGPYRTEIWRSTPRLTPEGSAYLPWLRQVFRGADQHGQAKPATGSRLPSPSPMPWKRRGRASATRWDFRPPRSFLARQNSHAPHPQRNEAYLGLPLRARRCSGPSQYRTLVGCGKLASQRLSRRIARNAIDEFDLTRARIPRACRHRASSGAGSRVATPSFKITAATGSRHAGAI